MSNLEEMQEMFEPYITRKSGMKRGLYKQDSLLMRSIVYGSVDVTDDNREAMELRNQNKKYRV